MTIRKDLKRRVRQRQEKTGESYTAARAQVLGKRPQEEPGAIPVSALHDVSALCQASGLPTQARVTSALWDLRDDPAGSEALVRAALARLREVLIATEDDPALDGLRRVLLLGEADAFPRASPLEAFAALRRFLDCLRLGVRGPSQGGRLVAFDLTNDDQVITLIAAVLPRIRQQAPLLLLLTAEECLRPGLVFSSPAALAQFFLPR